MSLNPHLYRNLKTRTRTLRGHSNWVKNIEYHRFVFYIYNVSLIWHNHYPSGENLLVTSGFDGAIYTWDINKYQETQAEFKKGKSQLLKLSFAKI